jgi:hypothetical protein
VHEKAKSVARCINAGGEMVHALGRGGEMREFGGLALKFGEQREWGRVELIARCDDIVVRQRRRSGLSEARKERREGG